MPSHPDRVRRNYVLGFPVVEHPPCSDPACALCASGALVLFGDPAQPHRAILITDQGFTANVIEGDPD